MNQGQEDNGFTIHIVFCNFLGNLPKVGFQRIADLPHVVIPIADADLADVQLQRNHLGFDRAQVSFPDGLRHGVFISLRIKKRTEVTLVCAVRSRCNP